MIGEIWPETGIKWPYSPIDSRVKFGYLKPLTMDLIRL